MRIHNQKETSHLQQSNQRKQSKKKRLLISSFLLLITIGLTACGGGTQQESAQLEGPADAVQVYKKSCLSCHAADLSGKMGPETNLTTVGDRLTKDQIVTIIKEGKGRMPSQSGRVSDEDAEKVAAWLATKKEQAK
ncbi:c-type cytochrome [Paenibacillus agilis]|uniref:Cytochrome c n=1 Tax=Paenibacillus agilis TaxID=3020863 RepID=A0A559IKZ1_9BACL|nr:cytochrome c [Paenibacillus agilis]TVX88301.1 cytochrome c [Paenibacillus agilis]